MKKQGFIILIFLLGWTSQLLAQRIVSVQAMLKDDKVLIGYQVKGLRCDQNIGKVSFYVSEDYGKSYVGPLNNIVTDESGEVRNGKYIVEWDALKEMPFTDETLVFDVRAELEEKKRKRAIMLSYVGNAVTPLGARLGQLGKVSWYIEGRASLHANQPINYTYKGIQVVGYPLEEGHYTQATSEKGWKAYSAIVGATFQAGCNFFFYVGIGYGFQEYVKKFDEYDDDNMVVNSVWAKESGNTLNGVELNGGMIYRYKKMIFSAGMTAINLEKYNWTLGFGVAL